MNIPDWIEKWARAKPGKAAILFEGGEMTYPRFNDEIKAAARLLKSQLDIAPGDRVAYLGQNHPQLLVFLFACARLGAILVPLNWRLAPREHVGMLRNCGAKAFFIDEPYRQQCASLDAELPGCRFVAMAQGGGDGRWPRLAELSHRADGVDRHEGIGLDSPLLIIYTSGTTGSPKGAVLTQEAVQYNAFNSALLHDMTSQDLILSLLPLFHVGGLNNQTTPALRAGCTVVLHPRFDADATFDAIEQDGITLTVLVPAQLDMMMAHRRWAGADFSGLRMITTGSTIVPRHVIHAVHAKGVPLVQVYGSTETCPIAAYLKAGDAMRKVGSTGKAAAHCRLRIVDSQGADVKPGATGEILVRGDNVMSGYWQAPQATAAVLVDGWYHSGDMGHQDDEGYLYVDGRSKEMIISGGENIYPAEIENLLIESPDIAEASVIGRPDARWGEIVVAVVVPKADHRVNSEQVMKLLEGRIARYKHPKEVIVVEALPKTALGKIRKEDVRQMATHARSHQST